MALEWHDETMYLSDDTGRAPKLLVCSPGGVRVIVHRLIGAEGWFLTVDSGAVRVMGETLGDVPLGKAKHSAMSFLLGFVDGRMKRLARMHKDLCDALLEKEARDA